MHRCFAGSHHHDESKPAGREGPGTRKKRLYDQSKVGIGNQNPA